TSTINQWELLYVNLWILEGKISPLKHMVLVHVTPEAIVLKANVTSTPLARFAHANILVNSKLYFIGGELQNGAGVSNELFFLDLSVPFVTSSPQWTDLSPAPVSNSWCSASLGGSNNNTIFLIGGLMFDSNNKISNSLVYTFNTIDQTWSSPKISGHSPQRRKEITSIVNPDDEKIYIFGGLSDATTGSSESKYFNNFIILDTVHLTWTTNNSSSTSTKRAGHTLTICNKILVLIGGKEIYSDGTVKLADMNKIWTYDMNSGIWSLNIATGDNIDSRIFHTAVLDHHKRIIIYGGMNDNSSDPRVSPDLAILDITTTPFKWIIPKIPPDNAAPPLAAHTAIMMNYYMIISFGKNTTLVNNENPVIYLFDTVGYKWVTSYSPNISSTLLEYDSATNNASTDETGPGGLSMQALIGIVVGAVFVGLGLLLLFFVYYQRYRRKISGGGLNPIIIDVTTESVPDSTSNGDQTNQIVIGPRWSIAPTIPTMSSQKRVSTTSSATISVSQSQTRPKSPPKSPRQVRFSVDSQQLQTDSQQLRTNSRQSQVDSQQLQTNSRQPQVDFQQPQTDSQQLRPNSRQSQVDFQQSQTDSQQSRTNSRQSQVDSQQSQQSRTNSRQSQVDSQQSQQEDSQQIDSQRFQQASPQRIQYIDPQQYQQVDPQQHQQVDPLNYQQGDPQQYQLVDPRQYQQVDPLQYQQVDPLQYQVDPQQYQQIQFQPIPQFPMHPPQYQSNSQPLPPVDPSQFPQYQPIYAVPLQPVHPYSQQFQPVYPIPQQPVIFSQYPGVYPQESYSRGSYSPTSYSPTSYSPIRPNFEVIPECVENEQPQHLYVTNDGQQEGYQQHTSSSESSKKSPKS
ncbi:7469_t:CDS:2, partial [Cetraspora pellucida]